MGEARRLGSSYVLEDVLGSGASGEVFTGHDASGHRWAFKVLRDELARDPGVVNRFVQERSVLASIRHPHVVGVHDLVVEGSTLAIVMDLVEGEDLRSLLQREGTLAPERVAALGAQVAAGLQAAHHGGVVHRDVKPENVLVDGASGDARVTDFGIARLVDASGRSTMLLGTPQYMAPEVAEGRSVTPAVDVYSLGVMLYELCCGVPPFAGRGSAMATLRAHAVDVPGRPQGVPDELWAVVESMMAKDPTQRPSAGDSANRLSELVGSLAGVAAAPRLSEPPPPATSLPFSGPSPDEAATILGAASVAGWSSGQPVTGTPDPRFLGQGYSSQGYGSGGYPSQGYGSGGYPSQGYPSQGFPTGGYPAPPPPPPARRSGALVGAALGALAVAVAGLGWMTLKGSSDDTPAQTPTNAVAAEASSNPAAPSPTPTPQAPETVTTVAPPPVTVTVPPTSAAPIARGDAASRRVEADGVVRTYLSRAESHSIARSEMADYFTPMVQWYQKGRISRDTLWRWIQPGGANSSRTEFATPEYQNFVTGLTYDGQPADRIEYRVGYVRYDSQGNETTRGAVTVCYVLVPNSDGNLRITQVYER